MQEVSQRDGILREVPGVDSPAEARGRLPGLRTEGTDGAGVNPDTRYSVDEEDGDLFRPEGMSDEQYERLNELWKNRPSAVRPTEPGAVPEGYGSVDEYAAALKAREEARLQNRGREEFKGSDALKNLGIKIANSVGIYGDTRQLIENDRAAKSVRNEMRRAERRLQATEAEKNFFA